MPTPPPVVLRRVPREWKETCPECHGSGVVHKREYFSLWTPDEYEHTHTAILDDPIVPKDAYVCTAVPGSSIFNSCREAIEIARIVGRPVAYESNGAIVVAYADSDPEVIAKAWWVRAYGRTYEETMEAHPCRRR